MILNEADITPVNGKPYIKVYSDDDLLPRAEKVVWAMNIRGMTGDYVIAVYRILEAYQKLDLGEGIESATSPQK